MKYIISIIGFIIGGGGLGFALSDMKIQPNTIQPYFSYQIDALLVGLFGSVMLASLLYLFKKVDDN